MKWAHIESTGGGCGEWNIGERNGTRVVGVHGRESFLVSQVNRLRGTAYGGQPTLDILRYSRQGGIHNPEHVSSTGRVAVEKC